MSQNTTLKHWHVTVKGLHADPPPWGWLKEFKATIHSRCSPNTIASYICYSMTEVGGTITDIIAKFKKGWHLPVRISCSSGYHELHVKNNRPHCHGLNYRILIQLAGQRNTLANFLCLKISKYIQSLTAPSMEIKNLAHRHAKHSSQG